MKKMQPKIFIRHQNFIITLTDKRLIYSHRGFFGINVSGVTNVKSGCTLTITIDLYTTIS